MVKYCTTCSMEIRGMIEEHECSHCGAAMCGNHIVRKGGFLGLMSGEKLCQNCARVIK